MPEAFKKALKSGGISLIPKRMNVYFWEPFCEENLSVSPTSFLSLFLCLFSKLQCCLILHMRDLLGFLSAQMALSANLVF